jgi:non-ribosomal peptide synthetase component F
MSCNAAAAGSASLIITRGLVAIMLAPILFLALSQTKTNKSCGKIGATFFFFLLLAALAAILVIAATMSPICGGDTSLAAASVVFVLKHSMLASMVTYSVVFISIVLAVAQLHALNAEAGRKEVQTEIDRRKRQKRQLTTGDQDDKFKRKISDEDVSILSEIFPPAPFMHIKHQEGVKFVHEIFERSCDTFPNSMALKIAGKFGDSVTYQELDERANQIAWSLEDHVFAKDDVVAVLLDREVDLFAAHLGILKSGGAVLMIDPVLPTSTVEHMIKDAKVAAVVTKISFIRKEHLEAFHSLLGPQAVVDTAALLRTSGKKERRRRVQWLNDDPSQILSNVIYTSGTTGMPKGVALCHAGYVNHHISAADEFSLVHGLDAASTAASAAFDASLEEWYVAWMSGCPLISLSYDQVRLGPDLPQLLVDEGVTWFQGTPSLLRTMGNPRDIPYPICRIVDAGGERLPEDIIAGWCSHGRRLINT